jgi:hypothetical protein
VEKTSDPGVTFGMGAIAALTAERHAERRLDWFLRWMTI